MGFGLMGAGQAQDAGSPPAASPAQAYAQAYAIEQGEQIAQRWCNTCHTIGPAGGGTDAAPSFATIASQRSAPYLKGFLANPHVPEMQAFSLSAQEIEHLVSYIQAQKNGAD